MKRKLLFIALVAVLVSGCVSTQSIVTGVRRAPVEPVSVRIYSTPPVDSEEIALLNVVAGGGGQYGMNLALEELKKKAGALGANGVLILSNDVETQSRGGFGTYNAKTGIFISDTSTEQQTKVRAKAIYVEEKHQTDAR